MSQRSNINLANGESLLEYSEINLAKSSQRVIQNQDGHAFDAGWIDDINEFDYPTETTVGISHLYYFPETGSYVARWQESGSFALANDTSPTNASSGIYTGGGADGSVVTNGRFTFNHVRGTSTAVFKGTTVSNLVVCLASEEALYDAGQRLRPRFKTLIAAYNPDTIRFMDRQSTNVSVAGQDWADNPPFGRLSHHSSLYRPNKKLGLLDQSGGTNVLTAPAYTGMPVTYQHGEYVHGRVATSNDSTTVTLEVGGRGAKAVGAIFLGYPATILATGTDSFSRLINNFNYTFTYDAYYDQFLFGRDGANAGHPIEAMVAMCNELNVAGWFCIPFYASDAWITAFANYLAANYTPSFVKIEFINEFWNSASGFYNFHRVRRAGQILMGIVNSYTGLRFRQIQQIMAPILGSKLEMVLAGQGADISGTENLLFQNTSAATSGTLGTPAANVSGANAPILFATHISYAVYYGGTRIKWTDSQWTTQYDNPPVGVTGIDDVLAAADNFALGTPAGLAAAVAWLYADFTGANSILESIVKHPTTGRHKTWNDLAVEYDKLVAHYEYNQEFAAPSTSWCTGKGISTTYGGLGGKIDLMLQYWLNSNDYQRVVALNLQNFYALSNSESCSLYAMGIQGPWQCFPPQTTTSTLGGDTMQDGLGNWRAHCKRNNGIFTYRLTAS